MLKRTKNIQIHKAPELIVALSVEKVFASGNLIFLTVRAITACISSII